MHVSISIAFIAGIVSFLSPCILPIVPGFLAYLAGNAVSSTGASRREMFLNAVAFVLGFSTIFALLGVLLQTTLLHISYAVRIWLSRLGGVLIIAFGLYLAKVIPIPWLDAEHKMSVGTGQHRNRYTTSFLFGAAFAAGWTPCVGAILGAILTLALTQPGSAFWLLLAYSLGLGIPFLVVGALAASAQQFINRFAGAMQYIAIAFGWILVIVGILVFTQQITRLANFGFVNNLLIR